VKTVTIRGGDVARGYEEASATRRARLPVETQRDGAIFGQTYRLAVQVMERREILGLTQTELAERTGIDQGDISRIERGSIFANEKTRLRLADPLGAEWRLVDKATARIQL
jgi:ribosome-binding protein aMBF1 (putative translation factor)